MMWLSWIIAVASIVSATGVARAEKLTVAVSTPEVKISSNFTGTEIVVFGVVERDQANTDRPDTYQVAVLLLGPPETVVARRKDRVLGVWANRASETIVAAPSFYHLSTSADLEALSNEVMRQRLRLGFDNIAFTYQGRAAVNDQAAAEFRRAFVRLKERAGLYGAHMGVKFIGETIFRSTVFLPANILVGRYAALVYLFSGEALIAHGEATISVSKTGFGQAMSAFAHGQALIYGLAAVALALFVGWLGGVIFRRD